MSRVFLRFKFFFLTMSTQRKRTRTEDSDDEYEGGFEGPSQKVKTMNSGADDWGEEVKLFIRLLRDSKRLIDF